MSEYFIVRVLSKYDIDDREIAEKLLSLPIKKVIENIQIFREENLVRELYRNDYDDERDAIRYLLDNIFNIDIEVLDYRVLLRRNRRRRGRETPYDGMLSDGVYVLHVRNLSRPDTEPLSKDVLHSSETVGLLHQSPRVEKST